MSIIGGTIERIERHEKYNDLWFIYPTRERISIPEKDVFNTKEEALQELKKYLEGKIEYHAKQIEENQKCLDRYQDARLEAVAKLQGVDVDSVKKEIEMQFNKVVQEKEK